MARGPVVPVNHLSCEGRCRGVVHRHARQGCLAAGQGSAGAWHDEDAGSYLTGNLFIVNLVRICVCGLSTGVKYDFQAVGEGCQVRPVCVIKKIGSKDARVTAHGRKHDETSMGTVVRQLVEAWRWFC